MKKHKTAIFIALLIGGIILICVGGLLKGAEMKSIAGVCIGVGAGIFGLSLAQLIILRISSKSPAYKRKVEIEDKDERNITIRNRAKAKAFDAMGVILGITMLIYALISADLIVILLNVAAYLIIYGVLIYYLSKYAKQM